jgi:hypothetical protein
MGHFVEVAGVVPGSGHGVEAMAHEYLGIHVEGALKGRGDREVFSDCLGMAGIVGSLSDDRSGPFVSAGEHIGSLPVRWGLSPCKSSHRKDEDQRSRRRHQLLSSNLSGGYSSRSVPASSSSASYNTEPGCHRSATSSSIARGPQALLHCRS